MPYLAHDSFYKNVPKEGMINVYLQILLLNFLSTVARLGFCDVQYCVLAIVLKYNIL